MSEEQNPYLPPATDVAVGDGRGSATDASKLRRFGTFAVDYVLFMVCGGVFGFSIALVFGESGVAAIKAVPEFLLGVPIFIGYYLFFEGLWSRTPGKFVFVTVVVNDDLNKPSFLQIVKRTFCRFIPFEPFSFFGARGWHDSISKTRVILKTR